MGFQELMIREEHLTGLGVLGMADTPGLSTVEMQKKLEELSRELIIPRINLILEELSAELGNSTGSFLGAYPVGSIYLSVSQTDPGTLFGGTWERIQDAFLLAAGSTYAAGTTGGEAEHALTVEELPPHTHEYHTSYGASASAATTNGKLQAGDGDNAWNWGQKGAIVETGGGLPHNNMPPYLAVYAWKRTA